MLNPERRGFWFVVVKIDFKPVVVFFTQKTSFAVPCGFFNYIPAATDRTRITGFFLKYLSLFTSFRTN
jgi:hypothetical protein